MINIQVFMPYNNFFMSTKCLDDKRLGNQIYRECKTLINGKWPNHPISKMWKNYKYSLCLYAIKGLWELMIRKRFYPHHFKFYINKLKTLKNTGTPPFIYDEEFINSHKSNLLRKNYNYYKQFN